MTLRKLQVQGELGLPGDKSLSHRALIFAALGTGVSSIDGILQSDDVHATASVLRALGHELPGLAASMKVNGTGLRPRRPPATCEAPCANSGTTARLLAGVAAAQSSTTTFDGDSSLRRRPMRRIATPLSEMGAGIRWLGDGAGRLPMEIRGGGLRSLRFTPDVASAQVKSGVLLAGLCAGVPVAVREVLPTRDHTERLLLSLGVDLTWRDGWIELAATAALPAARHHVPGDPSSGAFFAALAAGAARGSITLRSMLLNARRVGFLRVIERMGVVFDVHNESERGGESVGDVVVHASPLRGATVTAAEVPDLVDELPVLAALAAVAEGETRVSGALELRTKESDRIALIVSNLRACGVDADELPDGFVMRGAATLRAARIVTGGDHRIAMSFAILSALGGVPFEFDDASCVSVSFPAFWTELGRFTSA